MLQQWCSGLSWNYPSWSISTEAEAYLYFLFFSGLLLSGKRPRVVAIFCVAVLTTLGISQGGCINYFVGLPALLRTLAGFSLGVLIYRFYSLRTGVTGNWVGVLAVLLLGLAAITRMDSIAVCGFAFVVYGSANATNVFARFLETRPLVALGNWSYSVYLWHAPISFAVMGAFAAIHHPVGQLDMSRARLLLFTTACAVVIVAALHYRFVETPIRQLVRRPTSPLAPPVLPQTQIMSALEPAARPEAAG
jgi:peptidoglycan/LPS O-acetylase OafA/YrhL